MHYIEGQLFVVISCSIHPKLQFHRSSRLRSKHRGFSEDDDPAFAESQGNPLCTPGGRNLFPGFAVNVERRVGQPQKKLRFPGGL